jgi:hypothetical protein
MFLFSPYFYLFLILFLGAGERTKGLILARLMLYHLDVSLAPEVLS